MKKIIQGLNILFLMGLVSDINCVNINFINNSNSAFTSITYPNSTSKSNSNQSKSSIILNQGYISSNPNKYAGLASSRGNIPLNKGQVVTSPDSWPVNGNYVFTDTNGSNHIFNVNNLTTNWTSKTSSANINTLYNNSLQLNIGNVTVCENGGNCNAPSACGA